MDLEKINPKAYAMWKFLYDYDPQKFELKKCSPEQLQKIETLMDSVLPKEYKEFMLKYYKLHPTPKIGACYFKCDYKSGSVIDFNLRLIPPASSTINAIEALGARDEAPVIPEGLMPLTYDNYSTLLVDLRSKTFGYIWNIFEIKRQQFGTPGNDWDEVGFVAKSLTEFIAGLDTEEALIEKYGLPVWDG